MSAPTLTGIALTALADVHGPAVVLGAAAGLTIATFHAGGSDEPRGGADPLRKKTSGDVLGKGS